MAVCITPQEFVIKWRASTAKERSVAQEHFIDLCRLIGHPTPIEMDPAVQTYTFETGAKPSPKPPASWWKSGIPG